ncbi:MAG TPA: TetR/AcrR family transcriptional regulator [Microthrixaceae bacterium]|nr:TetR/AcrR family transcriptional regulator [Microthrixaceae bacterium]
MTTRRLTPRGQERREQLIGCATRLFATKGYHPTSVADIVDELGVGKGVFYWYFSSKDELFVEILREAQTDMRRRQQREISEEPDPVRRIELGIRAAVSWASEHADLFQLFEFAVTDEQFVRAMRAGRSTLVNDAVAHLKDAIAEGRIPDQDPERLAHAVLGVSSMITMEYVHHRHEDPEAVAEAVVDFCLHGIGVPNSA